MSTHNKHHNEELKTDNLEIKSNEDLTKQFESKLEQEKEKFLLIIADYENKIKRQQIDSKNFIQRSIEKIVLDIVPLIEDLNSAITIANQETQEGLKLIIKNLKKILFNHGITEIMPKEGDSFDLELHQAINSSNIDFEKAIIQKTLKPGYKYENKIIQSALVIVE